MTALRTRRVGDSSSELTHAGGERGGAESVAAELGLLQRGAAPEPLEQLQLTQEARVRVHARSAPAQPGGGAVSATVAPPAGGVGTRDTRRRSKT